MRVSALEPVICEVGTDVELQCLAAMYSSRNMFCSEFKASKLHPIRLPEIKLCLNNMKGKKAELVTATSDRVEY